MLDTLENQSRHAPAWLMPAMLITFVVGLLPFTADYLLYHPDERHYADAAIRMQETGDYLTPRTAEGELRLKKPILPYWCVVAGFRAAGISPLGARSGFLLCGAAVVGLAWWGASIAFGSRRAATFAAAAAMTQPALWISAPRSVPDVCLALGIQLSACGFLLVVRAGRATNAGLAAASAGGAIAILSKGLPAAAFVGFALAFLAWRSPALLRRDWRSWLCAGAIGAAVSGSWYVLMAVVHHGALAEQFTSDQLGPNRFAAHLWQPVAQFPLCVGLLLVMSAPWWLAAVMAEGRWLRVEGRGARGEGQTAARLGQETGRNRGQETGGVGWGFVTRQLSVVSCHLTGGRGDGGTARIGQEAGGNLSVQLLVSWAIVYCGLAATINHVTPRYLLPAAAPLSIVIGGALAGCDAARLRWALARIGLGLLLALIAATLLVGFAVRGSRPEILAGALMLATFCGVGVLCARRWSALRQALAIATVAHAVLFAAGVGLSTWRGTGLAGIARHQRAIFAAETPPRIVIGGEAAHASQLRVAVGSTTRVVTASSVEHIRPTDVLVLDAALAAECELSGCRVSTIAAGYHVPTALAIARTMLAGDLLELLRHHERRFVIAVPDERLRPVVQQTSGMREQLVR